MVVLGLLAGPALEYNDYIRAMDGTIYQPNTATATTITSPTITATTATAAEVISNNNNKHNTTPTTTTSTPTPPTSTSLQIPSSTLFISSLGACVHRIAVALICLLLYFGLSSKCPISRHRDVYWQTHTPGWWRLLYIWVSFLGMIST